MNPIFKSFIGCVIFLSSSLTWNAFAQSNEKIKAELQRQFGPQIQIKSISPAPLPGLFEVVANNSVIYTDSQAKFLFQGSIVDLKTGNNLTEMREEELNLLALERKDDRDEEEEADEEWRCCGRFTHL
jgi:thiol:disulfide interchange protein DsbC